MLIYPTGVVWGFLLLQCQVRADGVYIHHGRRPIPSHPQLFCRFDLVEFCLIFLEYSITFAQNYEGCSSLLACLAHMYCCQKLALKSVFSSWANFDRASVPASRKPRNIRIITTTFNLSCGEPDEEDVTRLY